MIYKYYLKFYFCLNLIFLRQVLFLVAVSVQAVLNHTFSAFSFTVVVFSSTVHTGDME
jgi:hypothetical protein